MAGTVRVSRALPQATADTTDQSQRGGRYGETTINGFASKHSLAEEGSYYVATNPTPGTAIAASIAGAYSATASAYFYIRNTESASAAAPKRIILDYIKLITAVIPANAVEWTCLGELDFGAARYTSGGSAITPVNVNTDVATASIATMYAGALTTVAGVTKRIVLHSQLGNKIPVVYDQYILTFGAPSMGGSAIAASGAAYGGRTEIGGPPIVIGPATNFVLFMWGTTASATASQYEFEVGWWER